MQLLYGNDGVNYRLIDRSSEMTEGIQKSMLATYSKYEFVTNWREYSSIDKEPEAITYVTSNLDNQMPSDQMVVCKTGHMRQFSSPSYYFHGLVQDVSDDFYKKDFFQIFNYEFVRDIEIGSYSNGSIHEYSFATKTMDRIALTEDQLIVILASFMSNEKKGKKTKIFVDAVGDEYNSRSREILAAIYHYLPYELRKRYGFKSYSRDERNLPARVSFVLFNQHETIDTGDYITLKETVEDIQQTVEKNYIEYATFLVKGMDAEAREQHFASLSKLSKNGRLTINECITYYSNLNLWSQGTQEELLPDWIQYIDQNSFRKGALYELLLEIVVQKVDNDYYNDYLFDEILELYKENIYNLSPLAAKTIRFADCLDEIYIEPDRFHKWYRSKLAVKLNALSPVDPAYEMKLQKLYEQEIEALKTVNIMSEELSILIQKEIDDLSAKCCALSSNIDDQKEQEIEAIGRKLSALDNVPIGVFVREVNEIQRTIQFEENKKDFSITVEEWIDKNFPRKFRNPNELNDYYKSFIKLEGSLSSQKYNECLGIIVKESKRMESEKEARISVIEKSCLLKSYTQLLLSLENGVINSHDKVQVAFGTNGNTKLISADELKSVLEFILCPSDDNRGVLTMYTNTLLQTNVLTAEHLRYLLSNNGLREFDIQKILDYYFRCSVKVSGRYIAQIIAKRHIDKAKTLIGIYEDEDGEAGIFAEKLKQIVRSNVSEGQSSRERHEENTKTEKAKKGAFGGLFGGKR